MPRGHLGGLEDSRADDREELEREIATPWAARSDKLAEITDSIAFALGRDLGADRVRWGELYFPPRRERGAKRAPSEE